LKTYDIDDDDAKPMTDFTHWNVFPMKKRKISLEEIDFSVTK